MKIRTLLQPDSQDNISLFSPGRRDFGPLADKWFMLGTEPERTGTNWHKLSSLPRAKAPSAGWEGRGLHFSAQLLLSRAIPKVSTSVKSLAGNDEKAKGSRRNMWAQ